MNPTDPKKAEEQELNILAQQGSRFTVPRKSILGRGRERAFIIPQPYLGTLDLLSREFIRLGYSDSALKEDPFGESKRMTGHARTCARVVALAILNSRWKIRFLAPALTQYLLWRVTPAKLLQLVQMVNLMMNLQDFTISIRLMSSQRTTMPDRMEETGA